MKPSDIFDILAFSIPVNGGIVALSAYRDCKRAFTKSELNFSRALYPHVARCLRLINQRRTTSDAVNQQFNLTIKESEVVSHLMFGMSYNQICDELKISNNTLKWHLKNIFLKFDVSSLASLLVKLHSIT